MLIDVLTALTLLVMAALLAYILWELWSDSQNRESQQRKIEGMLDLVMTQMDELQEQLAESTRRVVDTTSNLHKAADKGYRTSLEGVAKSQAEHDYYLTVLKREQTTLTNILRRHTDLLEDVVKLLDPHSPKEDPGIPEKPIKKWSGAATCLSLFSKTEKPATGPEGEIGIGPGNLSGGPLGKPLVQGELALGLEDKDLKPVKSRKYFRPLAIPRNLVEEGPSPCLRGEAMRTYERNRKNIVKMIFDGCNRKDIVAKYGGSVERVSVWLSSHRNIEQS